MSLRIFLNSSSLDFLIISLTFFLLIALTAKFVAAIPAATPILTGIAAPPVSGVNAIPAILVPTTPNGATIFAAVLVLFILLALEYEYRFFPSSVNDPSFHQDSHNALHPISGLLFRDGLSIRMWT